MMGSNVLCSFRGGCATFTPWSGYAAHSSERDRQRGLIRTPFVLIVGIALVALSRASTINVRTDYDRHANFNRYRTFSIREGNSTGNPVMDQRIKADIESALQAKGLEEVRNGAEYAVVGFG
jgi:hypothetical protein